LWLFGRQCEGEGEKNEFQCCNSQYSTYICRPISATMAKKGNRIQVIMECTEHKESGKPGTSRYITTKNRKNTPERLEKKKFNPILKRMTVHKEIK